MVFASLVVGLTWLQSQNRHILACVRLKFLENVYDKRVVVLLCLLHGIKRSKLQLAVVWKSMLYRYVHLMQRRRHKI